MSRKRVCDYENLIHLHRQVQRLMHGHDDPLSTSRVCWEPLTDIYETGGEFILVMEVPGVARNDMEIIAEGREVRVKGVKNPAPEFGKANFHQMEREYGEFRRIFLFEAPIRSDEVDAVMKNGTLTVHVHKQEPDGNRIQVV